MKSETHREKGHMKTEMENEVTLSQAKEYSGLPETRVGRKDPPTEASEG